MSVKATLFALFLYVCLVWVIAFRIHPGVELRDFGLLWTAVGLIAVLSLTVGGRLYDWVRSRRARPAMRAPVPQAPIRVIHEDDVAMSALIAEANAALARAPAYAAQPRKKPFYGLPVYFLIGPEGSGKTSTFLNSGLHPQLLAGDAGATNRSASTRLCNIWFAKNSVYVELSGKAFSGDPDRWRALVRAIQGKTGVASWRRLWQEPEGGADFRGVIGFLGVKELIGASADPQRLERHCGDWRTCLRAFGEVFGIGFPIYQVISKSDAIPFFGDYFRQLSEADAGQVFGSSLPLDRFDSVKQGELIADVEAKRLTASFRALYRSTALRRISQLSGEPQQRLRPAIYEFPRELKRIRSSLVQFLTDAFRPDVLRPGAVLRGYYLTGIRSSR